MGYFWRIDFRDQNKYKTWYKDVELQEIVKVG